MYVFVPEQIPIPVHGQLCFGLQMFGLLSFYSVNSKCTFVFMAVTASCSLFKLIRVDIENCVLVLVRSSRVAVQ